MTTQPVRSRPVRWILAIAVFEIFNAAYLAAFDTASTFHQVNVLLHKLLGIPLALAILFQSVPALLRSARRSGGPQGMLLRTLAAVAAVFVGSGLILLYTGSEVPRRPLLKVHVFSAIAGGALLLLLVWAWANRRTADRKSRAVFRWNFAVLGAALAFPLAVHSCRAIFPPQDGRPGNSPAPPPAPVQQGDLDAESLLHEAMPRNAASGLRGAGIRRLRACEGSGQTQGGCS